MSRTRNFRNDSQVEANALAKCTGASDVTVTHERRNEDGTLETIAQATSFKIEASEKQLAFIDSLLDGRVMTDDERNTYRALRNAEYCDFTKKVASGMIESLLKMEQKPKASRTNDNPLPDVPAGRYAVKDNDDNWSFYKVDRPDKGRWEGYTFVKRLVASGGFGDDLSEQRLTFEVTRTILAKIVDAGIETAMTAYGRELGVCGHCGRALTDEVSIERGIGPVCASKMGW